jgi:hypothetical protein
MNGITVFDFDQSVSTQTDFLREFDNKLTIKSMQRFKHVMRLWCSSKNFKKASATMQLEDASQFVLLGSGDYHHLTLALLEHHQAPLTLVLFDNHPDWMRPPHQYHCGTWVYAAARMPQVKRIVIIGLENGDLIGKKFLAGDVDSYKKQKIVLLPYSLVEAQLEHSDQSLKLQSKLKQDLKTGVQEILDAILTEDVYISIDKDCLRAQDAITNWEQGTLPLDTVLASIRAIDKLYNIVGADTVGDYSAPIFTSPLKWIGSWMDRPANAWAMKTPLLAKKINGLVNIKLANALGLA